MELVELGPVYSRVALSVVGVVGLIHGVSAVKPIWIIAGAATFSIPFIAETMASMWSLAGAVGFFAWLLDRACGSVGDD